MELLAMLFLFGVWWLCAVIWEGLKRFFNPEYAAQVQERKEAQADYERRAEERRREKQTKQRAEYKAREIQRQREEESYKRKMRGITAKYKSLSFCILTKDSDEREGGAISLKLGDGRKLKFDSHAIVAPRQMDRIIAEKEFADLCLISHGWNCAAEEGGEERIRLAFDANNLKELEIAQAGCSPLMKYRALFFERYGFDPTIETRGRFNRKPRQGDEINIHAPHGGYGGKGGYVYIADNAALGGLYKVGMTTRTVAERMRELNSSTSIPAPFTPRLEIPAKNAFAMEQMIHRRLKKYEAGKEFFRISRENLERELSEVLGRKIALAQK